MNSRTGKTILLISAGILIISYFAVPFIFPKWEIRQILSEEFPGLFKSGYVIEGPLTIEEIETQFLTETTRRTDCPQLPFCFGNDVWEEFKALVQDGDEIYFFSSDPASWQGLAGREGYVLVRQGELIQIFLTLLS